MLLFEVQQFSAHRTCHHVCQLQAAGIRQLAGDHAVQIHPLSAVVLSVAHSTEFRFEIAILPRSPRLEDHKGVLPGLASVLQLRLNPLQPERYGNVVWVFSLGMPFQEYQLADRGCDQSKQSSFDDTAQFNHE